jgi:hypothetical protein
MSKLKVNSADFLICRTIDSAPHNLFIRELFQNALEASSHAKEPKILFLSTNPADYGLTEFGYSDKKLTFWNNGKGMTADELRSATDLSSTISKTQSIHHNFGVGLTTCAGNNKSGLIVISYKNKKCNLVLVRREISESNEEYYVRHDFCENDVRADSGWADILEVPQEVVDKFAFPTDEDEWTAVICCGNLPDQNTVVRPYSPTHDRSLGWLLADLYRRYFYIPENIKVRTPLHAVHKKLDTVAFKPILNFMQGLDESANVRYETVFDKEANMKFTYVYDGPYGKGGPSHQFRPSTTHNNNSSHIAASFSGIVYKNEIYDIQESDKGWKSKAQRCGITNDARYFRIFPELLNADIMQDEYRKYITRSDNEKTMIIYEDFYGLILKNMPVWFKEKISDHKLKTQNAEDIREDLQKYLDSLLITETVNHDKGSDRLALTSKKPGSGTGSSKPGNNTPVGSPNKVSRVSFGTKHTISITVPEIIYIDTEEKMQSASVENLEYHAAEYVSGQAIYINCFYDVIDKAADILISDHTNLSDEEFVDVKEFARNIAQTEMSRVVGKAIVRCIARNQYKGFSRDDMEKAWSPVSLSIHADTLLSEIDDHKDKLHKKVSEMFAQKIMNGKMTETFNMPPPKTAIKTVNKQQLLDKIVAENPCFEF